MTTIGVVGGLGTETSCSFCFSINKRVQGKNKVQPHLIMDNLPMSDREFHKIANGEESQETFRLLRDSVIRLNNVNCNLIIIPCNTVHIFIEQLRKISKIPIISIIEETAKECLRKSFKKVGVIGSATTTRFGLHKSELERSNVEVIELNEKEQETVTNIILKIIHLKSNNNDKDSLLEIINNMKCRGAEAVILGCTDLFLVLKDVKSPLPLINTTEVLENFVVSKLTKV